VIIPPPPGGYVFDSLQILLRHGQRQPSATDWEHFKKLDEEIDKNIHHVREHHYKKFMKDPPLSSQFFVAEAEFLIRNGIREHHNMGKWWSKAIREMDRDTISKSIQNFCIHYHPAAGTIRCTHQERTSMSGNAFCDAFFKSRHEDDSYPDPIFMEMIDKDRDNLLRFFDLSHEYVQGVKKNPAITAPYDAFCNRWFPEVAVRIAQRIGSHPEWIPSNQAVLAMWRASCHQTVVFENTKDYHSIWTAEDALIMSYANDLHYFAQQGPKYPISTSITAPFFENLFLNQKEQKNGLYFAHEETVVPVIDALGLFYENLTEHYSIEQIEKRVWNLSEIAPYSTNIAFLFYADSSGDNPLVVVLHKGTPVTLPGQGDLFCPLAQFYRLITEKTGPLKTTK